jgi:hypothetical protein
MSTREFDAAFLNFMAEAQRVVNAGVEKIHRQFDLQFGPSEHDDPPPKLEAEECKKQNYIRIVAVRPDGRSAFGWVDKANGDVLKSAGWKRPAKNFARGNIFDDKRGCGRVRWTGVF